MIYTAVSLMHLSVFFFFFCYFLGRNKFVKNRFHIAIKTNTKTDIAHFCI